MPDDDPKPCQHEAINVSVSFNRFNRVPEQGGGLVAIGVDVALTCTCGVPFRWVGLPPKVKPEEPGVSNDGLVLQVATVPVHLVEVHKPALILPDTLTVGNG